jgi:hypothetical protein
VTQEKPPSNTSGRLDSFILNWVDHFE